jgi:hypothetical protein
MHQHTPFFITTGGWGLLGLVLRGTHFYGSSSVMTALRLLLVEGSVSRHANLGGNSLVSVDIVDGICINRI